MAPSPIQPQTIKYRHSCENCRRRKIKCSGTRPICDHCLRRGIQCIYKPLARSSRRPTSFAQSPRASFDIAMQSTSPQQLALPTHAMQSTGAQQFALPAHAMPSPGAQQLALPTHAISIPIHTAAHTHTQPSSAPAFFDTSMLQQPSGIPQYMFTNADTPSPMSPVFGVLPGSLDAQSPLPSFMSPIDVPQIDTPVVGSLADDLMNLSAFGGMYNAPGFPSQQPGSVELAQIAAAAISAAVPISVPAAGGESPMLGSAETATTLGDGYEARKSPSPSSSTPLIDRLVGQEYAQQGLQMMMPQRVDVAPEMTVVYQQNQQQAAPSH